MRNISQLVNPTRRTIIIEKSVVLKNDTSLLKKKTYRTIIYDKQFGNFSKTNK